MRALACALVACALAGTARADKDKDDGATDEQIVLVNANPKLGDLGQLTRLRRVLESHKMLRKLPASLEKTLEGRDVALGDVDAIRDAFLKTDFESALKLIEEDEQRVLANVIAGDPIPALAELAQWRGLIAAGIDQKDDAIAWFRVALRFNPAWTVERRYASPTVRGLVKKAHREVEQSGALRFDVDPEGAQVAVDGRRPVPATGKLELAAGKHLVVVTADDRRAYAELVDIVPEHTSRFTIKLDPETKNDRAARLVDETVAAPPGKARLKKTKALSKLTGTPRALVIEEATEDKVIARLYDVELKKVSRPIELEGAASSAAIARKIKAALDPDNFVDADSIAVAVRGERKQRWFQKWYVWAAIGAAVAVGGFATFEYASRSPTTLRGF